jgi:hypothetical protein
MGSTGPFHVLSTLSTHDHNGHCLEAGSALYRAYRPLKEGFSASNETLNNPRQRDLPCLMKGNWWQRRSSGKLRLANDLLSENCCAFWSESESLQTTHIWNLKQNWWAVVEKQGKNYWSLDFDNLNSKISQWRQIQRLWNLAWQYLSYILMRSRRDV